MLQEENYHEEESSTRHPSEHEQQQQQEQQHNNNYWPMIQYYARLNAFGRAAMRKEGTSPCDVVDLLVSGTGILPDTMDGDPAATVLLSVENIYGLLRENPSIWSR